MSLFRDIDVFKGIILASILLVPASVGFAWWMDTQLEESDNAMQAAMRRNGEIEQIGILRQNLVQNPRFGMLWRKTRIRLRSFQSGAGPERGLLTMLRTQYTQSHGPGFDFA